MSEAQTPARPALPTEATDLVTMREFEQRMIALHELYNERTRYEREILSTRENSMKDALHLADVETKRRLDELNHAHKMAAENWARSLPREMFEQWKDEHRIWRESIDRALTKIEPHGEALKSLAMRMDKLDSMSNKVVGGFVLVSAMGLAGVLALLLGLLRMSGRMP